MSNIRNLQGLFFALSFLALLAFTSSLAFAEVLTYDYDNAGQVKNGVKVAID